MCLLSLLLICMMIIIIGISQSDRYKVKASYLPFGLQRKSDCLMPNELPPIYREYLMQLKSQYRSRFNFENSKFASLQQSQLNPQPNYNYNNNNNVDIVSNNNHDISVNTYSDTKLICDCSSTICESYKKCDCINGMPICIDEINELCTDENGNRYPC